MELTDQQFWHKFISDAKFQRDSHGEFLSRIGNILPHFWDYSNNGRTILYWSFFIDHQLRDSSNLLDDVYESEEGIWCREQFGPALVHRDLMYTFWLNDADWMLYNNYAFFRRPEDCFAFQLRFR
ncbi:MAG: hypothetical protein EOP83_08595 [Verrucomicrobiaceae bacterium]|nr:MAG: hypothetical protein EOP83_08595 [Verrucomicrobiaceae bacterium]